MYGLFQIRRIRGSPSPGIVIIDCFFAQEMARLLPLEWLFDRDLDQKNSKTEYVRKSVHQILCNVDFFPLIHDFFKLPPKVWMWSAYFC